MGEKEEGKGDQPVLAGAAAAAAVAGGRKRVAETKVEHLVVLAVTSPDPHPQQQVCVCVLDRKSVV